MKLLTALLLICYFLPVHFTDFEGIPSEVKEEKIIWAEGRKLTWKDFRGVPNGPDSYVASTNSGVSFSFSYRERNGQGSVDFAVVSNFYPDLSWYRPSKVTNYILAHEQMHFDISELHARKLRSLLTDIPHDREFKEASEAIYERMEVERRQMQEQFDMESDHSNNEDAEYRWRKTVAQQLDLYEAWK